MISSEEAETAITAWQFALQENPELSWIRKSVLIERAYFHGLHIGLSAIAAEDDLRRLRAIAIKDLVWNRSGDDTFPSTAVGQAYSEFEKLHQARLETPVSSEQLTDAIDTIFARVEASERRLNESAKAAAEILSELSSRKNAAGVEDEAVRAREHEQIKALEHYLRIVALLETHHTINENLGV